MLPALALSFLKPETHSQKLYVNTSPLHYVIEKSEKEGQKDIVKLVFDSKVEESWIYVEKSKKGKWYEVGKDETLFSSNYCIFFSNEKNEKNIYTKEGCIDLSKIVRESDKIVFYHFHTANCNYLAEMPSEDDLRTFYHQGTFLIQRGFHNVQAKIIVLSGIYTLTLKTNAKEKEASTKEANESMNEITKQNTKAKKREKFWKEYEAKYSSFLRKCKDEYNTNKKIVKKFIVPKSLEINFEHFLLEEKK